MLVSAITLILAVLQSPASSPQRFKSSVDVVQVDVSAIDATGRPIRDLTSGDFQVLVDGTPRPIVSAQFISVPARGRVERPAQVPDFSSNVDSAGGRLIMVVVDRMSIATGRGRAAIDAASRFVSGLNGADRVALASIPDGPQITFTADHELVQRSLQKIDGMALANPGRMNLGVADALAFERQDDAAMASVMDRECGTANADGRGGGAGETLVCRNTVRAEAKFLAADVRSRARKTINGLRLLIESLPPSQTPKMLVLISEGLVIDRDVAQLSWLDEKAAAAHATVYTLHLEAADFDASQRAAPAQRAADRMLQEHGLATVAEATRGDMFRVVANSDFAFERLAAELSGYYLLGFEPSADDRNGKPHAISVSVARRGVTVRSRRQFTAEPVPVATLDRELRAALRDPLPASDIPLKLTTYTFLDKGSKLRMLIAADIDRSINRDGQMAAGYVVLDFDGRLIASDLNATILPPQGAGSTSRYVTSVLVDGGKYTVKFVVADDANRRGSVERVAEVRLVPGGRLRMTDLLLSDGRVRAGSGAMPAAGGGITSGTLYAYLELAGEAPAVAQANVTLEITKAGDPKVLLRVPMPLGTSPDIGTGRIAGVNVSVSDLGAGDYIARAVVSIGLDSVAEVSRAFTVPARSNGGQRPTPAML